MEKLPAAKVGYLKTTTVFFKLSEDISPLQSAMLLQIYKWFEVIWGGPQVQDQVWP